jgi:hypothetical protein
VVVKLSVDVARDYARLEAIIAICEGVVEELWKSFIVSRRSLVFPWKSLFSG